MTRKQCAPYSRNPKRALLKIAAIVGILLMIVGLLSLSIDQAALNQLKFDLSVWTVIALVLIINLISAASFIVLYAAYLWVRCDLKPPRSEDVPDHDPSAL